MEDRVYDYMSEIRLVSRQLNVAEGEERDLMRRIIEDWNEVKRVRSEQGFANTPLKLTIQTEEAGAFVCLNVKVVCFATVF